LGIVVTTKWTLHAFASLWLSASKSPMQEYD